MIQTRERRPGGGGVQQLGGVLDPQYAKRFRAAISRTVEGLIDALDALDDDPDLETTGLEDDFIEHAPIWDGSIGCPIADPGGCEHDGCEPGEDAEHEDGV